MGERKMRKFAKRMTDERLQEIRKIVDKQAASMPPGDPNADIWYIVFDLMSHVDAEKVDHADR
jgi:hypothetical protein